MLLEVVLVRCDNKYIVKKNIHLNNENKNIAVIPARKNSRGVKFKNRIFFNLTAQFVEKLRFIDKTIVTSDDKFILSKAKKDFETHNRKKVLQKIIPPLNQL